MKKLILKAAIIGIVCSAPAIGQSFTNTSFRDGYRYVYEVNSDTLKDTPSWNPEKAEPPVSLRRALQIGRVHLKRFVPKTNDKWDLIGVNLQRIGGDESKWVYGVDFTCFLEKEPCGDDNRSFTVYVKLDGSVIEPKVEPDNEPDNVKTGPPIKIAPSKRP